MRHLPHLALLLIACAAHAAEFGDKRDKPGEVQQLIVPLDAIPPSAPRTPQEEQKSFQIAPGFHAELIASEPLVEDPVVTQIGPDGRLWVVEMRGFMATLDGKGEELPVGRVVVLEDTDGDGVMDKKTVFLDGLIMPRALMLVGKGALVGAPPHLWYCYDSKGDGHADQKIEIASDFGWANNPLRPELGNPEQAANSLLWAFDNWIYAGHYTRKFRFADGQFTTGLTTFRGQWGLTQDNDGHFYYNANEDPLRADILPSQYASRNPNLDPCGGVNVQLYQDKLVWPIRVSPGVNRGYRHEVLRDNGRLKEFTSACSPYIYRGGMFPTEFDGNAFVCEPAGNVLKREIVTAGNGSLSAREAYDQREFMASTDERFRPVNLTTGPDGALYVTDFYRGVLQHRESFTTYLRNYSAMRGLDKPLHLGRIWRIVPDGTKPATKPALDKETPAQWVTHLASPNNWWRETAQRLLVERNDASVAPALRELATTGKETMGRVHALWTLDGLHQLDEPTVTAALKDSSPRVRAVAIRLSESLLKTDARPRILPQLLAMTNEPAPFTQQQLVLTLGEAAAPEADAAMANLVARFPENQFLADAALSGLTGRELPLLEHLVAQDPANDKFISGLARCIFASRRSDGIEQLLTLATTSPKTSAILDGILATTSTGRRKPVKFPSEPAVLKQIHDPRVTQLAALITWPGKPGAKPEPPIIPLTAEQQVRYDAGKELFNGVCAACHQPHGRGLEGIAPPLADSDWVLGPDQRLVRIVLHGLTGPVFVNGHTYRLDMPAFGAFSDDQISGVLTYVRRQWENNAPPVEPETVKAIRASTVDRHEAWIADQLRAIQ